MPPFWMMTSSNGNIFRIIGPLWGVIGGFLSLRPVMWSFDVFFGLCLNKWSSKQLRRQWFETPSCSLWHHCNGIQLFKCISMKLNYGMLMHMLQKFYSSAPVYIPMIHYWLGIMAWCQIGSNPWPWQMMSWSTDTNMHSQTKFKGVAVAY